METVENKDRITGYFLLVAEMETVSPLRIGSGKKDRADVEVIRLPNGEPYLPASGIVGALAHRYHHEVENKTLKQAGEIFWGTEMNRGTADQVMTWQSHFRVPDMKLTGPDNAKIRIRDGVCIDPVTNTAKEGMKYDYEFLEPGYVFTFRGEVTLRAGFSKDIHHDLRKLTAFVREALQQEMKIGGLTTRGFGQLKCNSCQIRHFDFQSEPEQARAMQRKDWFAFLDTKKFVPDPPEKWKALPEMKAQNRFSMRARFGLKTSLLIGAPGGANDTVDKVQLRSRKEPVISGKSLAGAIRHRSLKILQTLGVAEKVALEWLGNLFGEVDQTTKDRRDRKRAIKSKVTTHEARIEFSMKPEQRQKQTRIRIDRFSGGVVRGGLFESEPVWRQEGQSLELRIDIRDPEPWQPALLLHVLKDLWTGDLALGGEKNIGRGVLEGRTGELWFGEECLKISTESEGVEMGDNPLAQAALKTSEEAFLEKIKSTEAL